MVLWRSSREVHQKDAEIQSATPIDPVAEAEAAVHDAEQRLLAHRATREARAAELLELRQNREAALAADNCDEAAELAGEIVRAETNIDALNSHDSTLNRDLAAALQRLQIARGGDLRPQLDAAYKELAAAADHLFNAIEHARGLESRAERLGMIDRTRIPHPSAINGDLVGQWRAWQHPGAGVGRTVMNP